VTPPPSQRPPEGEADGGCSLLEDVRRREVRYHQMMGALCAAAKDMEDVKQPTPMVLLDTSHDFDQCRAELGEDISVGQLLTPLTRYRDRGVTYAIDNGAFSGFDARAFRSLLKRQEEHQDRCLFVAAPDVVGSARRTLEVFHHCRSELNGWPIALVAQDGQENLDIPWSYIKAVFIGGSTAWKLSSHAEAVVRAAKAMGKHTHVGQVNTPERFDRVLSWGVDSVDGTGVSRYSHMREKLGGANPLFQREGAAA
jgi:hypothetical protein